MAAFQHTAASQIKWNEMEQKRKQTASQLFRRFRSDFWWFQQKSKAPQTFSMFFYNWQINHCTEPNVKAKGNERKIQTHACTGTREIPDIILWNRVLTQS